MRRMRRIPVDIAKVAVRRYVRRDVCGLLPPDVGRDVRGGLCASLGTSLRVGGGEDGGVNVGVNMWSDMWRDAGGDVGGYV